MHEAVRAALMEADPIVLRATENVWDFPPHIGKDTIDQEIAAIIRADDALDFLYPAVRKQFQAIMEGETPFDARAVVFLFGVSMMARHAVFDHERAELPRGGANDPR